VKYPPAVPERPTNKEAGFRRLRTQIVL
jgi:hypothetical protein